MEEHHYVSVHSEYIELYKLIKRENLTASGGEAKHIISEGYVSVNGETELRKRRKVRVGDVVDCFDVQLEVVPSQEEKS